MLWQHQVCINNIVMLYWLSRWWRRFCNDMNPVSQQEKHVVDEEEVPAVFAAPGMGISSANYQWMLTAIPFPAPRALGLRRNPDCTHSAGLGTSAGTRLVPHRWRGVPSGNWRQHMRHGWPGLSQEGSSGHLGTALQHIISEEHLF